MSRAVLLLPLLSFAAAGDARAQGLFHTRLPAPGVLDLRATAELDGLASLGGGGLEGDVAVWRAGEGTVGLGAELMYGQCLLGCGGNDLYSFTRRAATPLLRVAYHFAVDAENDNAEEMDLYAVALAGAGLTFQSANAPGGAVNTFAATPLFGAGVGSLYFPGGSENVFAGGEVRALFGPPAAPGGLISPWQLSGLRLTVSFGVRL